MIFAFTESIGGKNRAAKYQKMFPTGQIEESILGWSSAEDS